MLCSARMFTTLQRVDYFGVYHGLVLHHLIMTSNFDQQ